MRNQPSFRYIIGFMAVMGFVAVPAAAQTSVAATGPSDAALNEALNFYDDDTTDAPAETGASYGRLLHYEGGIFLRRDGVDGSGSVEVAVNTPIIPGDQIWTGRDGRTEIQLADGSLVRIDVDSRVSFLNLADAESNFDNTTLLRVLNGSIYVRPVRFDPRDRRFQIDTPSGSVFVLSEGVFRVDVAADGATGVASYRGVAEVISNDQSVIAHSGERLTLTPDRTPGGARAFNTLRRDAFDLWSDNRDDVLARGVASQGPAPDVPEEVRPYMSELNAHGTWRYDDDYGWVWVPGGVDASWRPYYYGQWVYAPIGPTWVSYEPWGWAPYHYGRWSYTVGLGWFWSPGAIFSGAYVAWSVGPTYWGWCPVGYYDYPVFYPTFSTWIYVPHDHIYYSHVHRYAYGSAYISAHNVARNQIVLKHRPRIRPGYQLERTSVDIYNNARLNPSRGTAATAARAAVGQRVAFKQRENMAARRIAARQARPDAGSARGVIAPPSSRRALPSAGTNMTRPRIPAGGSAGAAARGTGRFQPIANHGNTATRGRTSPVTGKPMTPSVKITPPGSRGDAGNGQGNVRRSSPAGRQAPAPSVTPRRSPAVRGPAGQGAKSGSSAATRPHPRVLPNRGSSSGQRFVMPKQPPKPKAPQGNSRSSVRSSSGRSAAHAAPSRSSRSSSSGKSAKSGGKKKGGGN